MKMNVLAKHRSLFSVETNAAILEDSLDAGTIITTPKSLAQNTSSKSAHLAGCHFSHKIEIYLACQGGLSADTRTPGELKYRRNLMTLAAIP